MFRFDDQRVLVVGGSSGIGLSTAHAFGKLGARMTLASRAGDRLDRAAVQLGAAARALDVTDPAAIESFFAQDAPWHHVVVSAAVTKTGPVRQLALADAQAAMDSKFWGAYRIARSARIVDGGSLTLVSGYLSRRPSAASVLQGAINAALEALGRGLALELAPVRVNTVSPGLIDTALWSGLPDDRRQAMFDATSARLPVRRVGRAEDVAGAIVYLAATPFATGSTVFVDGGGSIA